MTVENRGCLGPNGSVVVLGISLCLVYLAFNGAQNLQSSSTITLGGIKLGNWSLGAIYLANTICGLVVAVPACAMSTDRNVLIGWILTVPLFIAAQVVYPKYTLLPVSALAGLSSGVQWTAVWGYLSSCISWKASPKDAAFLTGTFYGIMQCSQIFGNLASSLMLHHIGNGHHHHHHDNVSAPMVESALYDVYTGDESGSSGDSSSSEGRKWLAVLYVTSCVLGTALLFVLPNLQRESKRVDVPLKQKVMGMCNLLTTERQMLFMILLFVYSGYTQNFFFGVFTAQITAERHQSDEDVGYVMAWFGFSDAILSFLMGWMGSSIGGGQVIALSSMCCAGGIATLLALENHHTMITLSIIACLFGAADAGYNAIIVSTLTRMYPKLGTAEQVHKSVSAFSAFQCFQSGITAIAFFYQSSLSLTSLCIVFASSLVLGVVAYVVISVHYIPHAVLSNEQLPLLDDDSDVTSIVSQTPPCVNLHQ